VVENVRLGCAAVLSSNWPSLSRSQAVVAMDPSRSVDSDLNTTLVLERKDVELTFAFVAASAILLVASAVLSLLWFGRAQ